MKFFYAFIFLLCSFFCGAQINITSQPAVSNITNAGFTITWTTDSLGTTDLNYGHTPSFELGTLNGVGNTTTHVINVPGGPAEVFYVQGVSSDGFNTTYSDTKIFMTASNSSGVIKSYFTKTVDTSVALPAGNYAVQLLNTIDDTIAGYIDRADSTLDIAIYNLDNSASASTIIIALNNAYARGVRIRLIFESSNSNSGLSSLNPGIPTLGDSSFGLMHNKFLIADADAADANKPIVWTGSTNWTTDQLTIDANNAIVIQDQSLARAYTMEFEEMWGGRSYYPNTALSVFGSSKSDNTPHEFMIGGKRVEMYFSPSDSTTSHIIQTASTADENLFFALLTITRTDVATAIANRVAAGVYGAGLENDTSSSFAVPPFQIMQQQMGSNIRTYPSSLPGILHHKYLLVDVNHTADDPLVLTGSPNWSNNSTSSNDENMVIVHDQIIANQYLQEFAARFTESGGVIGIAENNSAMASFLIYPNPAHTLLTVLLQMKKQEEVQLILTDISGKILLTQKLNCNAGICTSQIDVAAISAGIYVLNIEAFSGSITKKVVIE
jgi:phosphatidylserine/phosphatidylglycerophosphate/cardiolipin synthase-like enzyme